MNITIVFFITVFHAENRHSQDRDDCTQICSVLELEPKLKLSFRRSEELFLHFHFLFRLMSHTVWDHDNLSLSTRDPTWEKLVTRTLHGLKAELGE